MRAPTIARDPRRRRRAPGDCPLLRGRTSGGRLFWIGSLSVIAAVVLLWTGPVPVPRAYGAAALALLGHPHPVGRPDDVVVDRARSLVGGVRSPARLLRLRAPRPARLPGRAAVAYRRRRARRPRRSRARVGAPRQGDPVALPGRRARRAAAQPGRLLELARARRRDRCPARPLGRLAPALARGPGRRGAPRLPRRARRRPHLLACRNRRRRGRRARVDRDRARPPRGVRRPVRSVAGRRARPPVDVLAAGAHRRSPALLRPGERRSLVRRPRTDRARPGRVRRVGS